jgi:hypothetical protein
VVWLLFGNRLATYRRGSGSDVALRAARAALQEACSHLHVFGGLSQAAMGGA